MEAKSEGWASGESAADDGLGAERVEAMAKAKLRGSRARPRRAKVRPYSNPFKEHCKNLIRGLDVEVASQAFKICAQRHREEGRQEEHAHCCEQRIRLVPRRNVENQVLPDREYC